MPRPTPSSRGPRPARPTLARALQMLLDLFLHRLDAHVGARGHPAAREEIAKPVAQAIASVRHRLAHKHGENGVQLAARLELER